MNAATNGQLEPPTAPISATLASQIISKLENQIGSAVLGKPRVIRLAIVALLAEGHILIEDVPGVGKTLLAKAIARSLGCQFHRIQCTPDLLASDLIGTSIFRQDTQAFVFQPGPLFAEVVLADEINRTTPRTQSALFEAMSERQISVDGETHPLGPPFIVLATQNPFDYEGTFALPESQLDRFLMRMSIGYPDRSAERDVLLCHRGGEPVDQLMPVVNKTELRAAQELVRGTRTDEKISDYILDLLSATRSHDDIAVGASPRAGISLYRAAQALARVEGRDYVIPDDVKQLAPLVLSHRLILRGAATGSQSEAANDLIAEILGRTTVPV